MQMWIKKMARFAALSSFAFLSRNGLVLRNINLKSIHLDKFWNFEHIDQMLGSVNLFLVLNGYIDFFGKYVLYLDVLLSYSIKCYLLFLFVLNSTCNWQVGVSK